MIQTENAVSILVLTSPQAENQARLALVRYQPYLTTDTTEARNLLKCDQPDLLIGVDPDPQMQRLMGRVREGRSTAWEPIVILLLSDTQSMPEMPADFVLPLQPTALIPTYIRQVLHQRDQFAPMAADLHALQAENVQLRHEIEAQRRSIDEMVLLKNAIVRNVSHELRTPLLQVKSAVALLAEDVQNNSLADYATNATARLEAIVTNITQLAGSQDIDPNPVIVRECVGYACRNLRRAWEHKGAAERIVTKIADDLPPAFADRQSLSTVMQLLIDNALKFSDDPVEVEAQQVGSRIRITVRDYGIGIAPDKLEAIFDSFYQVDNSSTRRYGGTGVGLAIVRLILDRHGVKIRVNSRPGHGSAFSFELPVAPTVS